MEAGSLKLAIISIIILWTSISIVISAPDMQSERTQLEAEESLHIVDVLLRKRETIENEHDVEEEEKPKKHYLLCDNYNSLMCDNKTRDSKECADTVLCETDEHHDQLACSVTFEFSDAKNISDDMYVKVAHEKIIFKGCLKLNSDVPTKRCSDGDQCIQTTRRDIASETCCCQTPQCNRAAYQFNAKWLANITTTSPAPRRTTTPTPSSTAASIGNEPSYDTIYIALIIVCGIILIVVVICSICLYVKRPDEKPPNQELLNPLVQSIPSTGRDEAILEDGDAVMMVPMRREEEQPLNITDMEMISRGRFGVVYRGLLTDDDGSSKYVAVKKIAITEKQSFDNELQIFELLAGLKCNYPAILEYYTHRTVDNELWIVTAFHERLSLFETLKMNVISKTTALRFIITMVDGLQFLHDERPYYSNEIKPVIIHRDIKSKNILVKRDMTLCIADFGLAKIYSFDRRNPELTSQVGTKRYMSPEVLEGATEFSSAAYKHMDVYAMALVMWEVVSRIQLNEEDQVPEYKQPYQDYIEMGQVTVGEMRTIVCNKKLRPKFREEIERYSMLRQMKAIAEEMWDPEAFARIAAACALERLLKLSADDEEESEGYQSSDENKLKSAQEALKEYNTNPSQQHPSSDPFKDIPYPPPIPVLGEPWTREALCDEDDIDDGRGTRRPQHVYDVNTRQFLTGINREQSVPDNDNDHSGRSTPTPQHSFFYD